jgi:NAD dependent epimerase/dehydratase
MGWTGTRVLVTGADGFIGSHLAERLVELGADVRAFCLYNSGGSAGWLDYAPTTVRKAVEVRLGDIRDARITSAACKGVDTVFHLAALISIPYSYTAPQSFVDTNITGTLNMLEAAHRAGCRRFVHTSTSEVYGTPASLPIREAHPLQGQSPYSATKIAADKLCEAYHLSFKLPVVTVRPFNTYGPRQSARAVLMTILSQLIAGQKNVSLGRLDPRRDLTFVEDTVRAFTLAGTAVGVEGEVIQLGTGTALSVGELFELACRVIGVNAKAECDVQRLRPEASEVTVLQADPSKAKALLGWEAAIPLEEGLRQTADWLLQYQHLYRPERYEV